MNFKKLFIIATASVFLMSGIAFAQPPGQSFGPPGVYQHSVTGNLQTFPNGHPGDPSQWKYVGPDCGTECDDNQAFANASAESLVTDFDISYDSTWWWGGWNDSAFAKAEGWTYGYGEADAEACGTHTELEFAGWEKVCYGRFCFSVPKFDAIEVANPADAEVLIINNGPDKVKAWSWAKDKGLESKAGAGAVLEGSACDIYVGAEAEGLRGGYESAMVKVGLGGQLEQKNRAGEEGYDAGYALGANSSGLGFTAYNTIVDAGQTYDILGYQFGGADVHIHGIEGKAITKGMTEVSIDPYGFHRSVSAMTTNFAKVNVEAQELNSIVYGGGNVAAGIGIGNTFANGTAGFGYVGGTYGTGTASVNASVTPGSAFVHSTAHSVGNAGAAPQVD